MDKQREDGPDQYLLDYLTELEGVIEKHAQITYNRRYLIYRNGYLYTGTDDYNDVMRLVDNDLGLYTYKINKILRPPVG